MGKCTSEFYKTSLLLLCYFTLQMTGQTLAKFAGSRETILNLFTFGSYVCLLSRGMLWILLLNRLPLISVYPLSGLSYVMILPLSNIVFSEVVSTVRLTSALLIAAGVAFITLGEQRNVHWGKR